MCLTLQHHDDIAKSHISPSSFESISPSLIASDHIKPDSSSLKLSERRQQAEDSLQSISSSSSIQIFGAGLVGVELASEIIEKFPSKSVTLRSRESCLLPGFTPQAQKYVFNWFRQHNVEIVLNNTIPPFKYVPTSKNELVFNCTGVQSLKLSKSSLFSMNDESKSKSLSYSKHVDPRTELVRVTSTFQFRDQPNIYALGDIMIEDENLHLNDSTHSMYHAPKVAYQSELQAWVVCENICRQSEGRSLWRFPDDLSLLSDCPTLVACSLGKNDGLLIFDESVIFSGKLAAINKDFIERSKVSQMRCMSNNRVRQC